MANTSDNTKSKLLQEWESNIGKLILFRDFTQKQDVIGKLNKVEVKEDKGILDVGPYFFIQTDPEDELIHRYTTKDCDPETTRIRFMKVRQTINRFLDPDKKIPTTL